MDNFMTGCWLGLYKILIKEIKTFSLINISTNSSWVPFVSYVFPLFSSLLLSFLVFLSQKLKASHYLQRQHQGYVIICLGKKNLYL